MTAHLHMKKHTVAVLLLGVMLAVPIGSEAMPAIIPAPQTVQVGEGVFKLTAKTRVCTDKSSRGTGEYLAGQLRKSAGYPVKVVSGPPEGGDILVTTRDAKAELGDEGYELIVTSTSAVIRAPKQAGAFYGVQSLLQLLPPQVFAKTNAQGISWEMPAVQIQDQPRFKWRGMMMDVGRHFFPVADVKQMIDAMALHKLNTLHWHLTDDQGWRIEINQYPKLTQVGARRIQESAKS